MKFETLTGWNGQVWNTAEPLYDQAFPGHAGMPTRIIRSALKRGIRCLHTASRGNELCALALTGQLPALHALVIDYLCVRLDLRGQGLGGDLLEYIRSWAEERSRPDCILVEMEAQPTRENLRRARFWESRGFLPIDGVHQYIWVPEPFRAMYLPLQPAAVPPADGEVIFRHLTRFHRSAYRKKD